MDVDAFDDAVRRGDTEEALALYTGDLLPENRFEDWVETRRTQLRTSVVRLLLDQASAREGRGDSRAALASLERLVSIDPLHEEAHARLMRLTAVGGDRHAALRWYTRLVEGLRDELGVSPTEELRRLHGHIAAGRLGPRVESTLETAAVEPVRAEPGPIFPAVDEERKLVTVLAVDLRGVRSDAGDADPERSRRTTGTRTDVIDEVLGRWNGTVERVVGGGAVAIFGYPAACEDHADRALWAGFEVLQRVPVSVRIGIDTGEVIAPSNAAGSLSDIGGDVLDSAARVHEAARPRALLATERTRRAARSGDFHFGDTLRLDDLRARPLHARRLLSAEWATDWRQPVSEAPLVGREDEMSAILSLVDEVATSGRPRLLTIVGAAGVGKSRLVREVVSAALRRRPETRVLSGRCLAAGVTFWALGEILREACGIAHGEAGQVVQEKLQARLRELLSLSQLDDTDVDARMGPRHGLPLAARCWCGGAHAIRGPEGARPSRPRAPARSQHRRTRGGDGGHRRRSRGITARRRRRPGLGGGARAAATGGWPRRQACASVPQDGRDGHRPLGRVSRPARSGARRPPHRRGPLNRS